MISNKDLRVEDGNIIINGEKHPLDPAVEALTKRANNVQGKFSALDTRLDAIEALEKTASGNPISLTGAAAAYAISNIMTIEPIQDLHGHSKPWPGGGGKNILPMTVDGIKAVNTNGTWTGNTHDYLGVSFTIDSDGDGNITGISISGTAASDVLFIVSNFAPIGTYKICGYQDSTISRITLLKNGTAIANIDHDDNPFTFTTSSGDNYIVAIKVLAGSFSNNIVRPMVILGNETDYTFAPYTNICPISGLTSGEVETTDGTDTNTATITFGQTVYGGSVNFKTGEVTVTHGIVDLGTLNWTPRWSTYGFRTYDLNNLIKQTDNQTPINAISSEAIILSWAQYVANTDSTLKFALYKDASSTFIVGGRDMTYADEAAFKTAMSGVQLCYELATPITLTLTPAELELLKGNNTVSGNGANINLSYIGR